MKYSVLMSVYNKEDPSFLEKSLNSMLNQTISPDEIILVIDGPLTDELYETIERSKKMGNINTIEFTENRGLGVALATGLLHCNNELIARMDTDDISVENRCEKQIEVFKKNRNLAIIGSNIAEFIDNTENIIGMRSVPETDCDIKKYMKSRNPINHPSVMFKKSEVLKAGNYTDFRFNEDYYLWIRMNLEKSEFYNIQEPLVYMRITEDTYNRRGGISYYLTQRKLLKFMYSNRVITLFEYILNNIIRFLSGVSPNYLRKKLYLKILRKK